MTTRRLDRYSAGGDEVVVATFDDRSLDFDTIPQARLPHFLSILAHLRCVVASTTWGDFWRRKSINGVAGEQT